MSQLLGNGLDEESLRIATEAYDPGCIYRAGYTLCGRLIETDTLYADGEPIAQIRPNPSNGIETLLYLHPDHLGAPRTATSATGTVVWRWRGSAFGEGGIDDDPDADGTHITINLRHPGQWFDAETGLFDNWHRSYEPGTGRYVQADPIGIDGGLNTYAYAESSPLTSIDPFGLKGWHCQRPLGKPPGTRGRPLFNHQYLCVTGIDGTISCGGLTTDGNLLSSESRLTRPDEDYLDQDSCDLVDDDKDQCFEQCVLRNFAKKRKPRYGIGPPTDCQEYADTLFRGCRMLCKMRNGQQ